MRNAFFGETGMIEIVPDPPLESDAATTRAAAGSAGRERRGRKPRPPPAREPKGSREVVETTRA